MVYTLHGTDLFHPHQDPDDHWDLACQYALAVQKHHELLGIMIDDPPISFNGDPDVMAVAQMNYLSGLTVPFTVGAKRPHMQSQTYQWMIHTLQQSKEPVSIHVIGTCRDVAYGIEQRPQLFADKCKAIYLNAGSAIDNGRLEYNVELDVQSYGKVFNAPCPVYWMPCFHEVPNWGKEDMQVGLHGSFYRFKQGEILQNLSAPMQSFFMHMLENVNNAQWLNALRTAINPDRLAFWGNQDRNMWCTAGFFHAVGLSVHCDGSIMPLGQMPECEVFSFLPIEGKCTAHGVTQWRETTAEQARKFIFTVNQVEKYPSAMVAAMKTLLLQL